MRRAALLALACAGCQSFGAFSQPTLLPAGGVRLGISAVDDSFHASDERIDAPDLALVVGYGISDRTEPDAQISPSTLEVRFKRALLAPSTFELALQGGAGFFTGYSANTSVLYVPVALVAGARASDDITLFLGPQAWGGLGLAPPTQEAGFDRGTFGLLGGGVAGVALDSASFQFCPQINVLTPLGTHASGTMVQVSFGLAARAH